MARPAPIATRAARRSPPLHQCVPSSSDITKGSRRRDDTPPAQPLASAVISQAVHRSHGGDSLGLPLRLLSRGGRIPRQTPPSAKLVTNAPAPAPEADPRPSSQPARTRTARRHGLSLDLPRPHEPTRPRSGSRPARGASAVSLALARIPRPSRAGRGKRSIARGREPPIPHAHAIDTNHVRVRPRHRDAAQTSPRRSWRRRFSASSSRAHLHLLCVAYLDGARCHVRKTDSNERRCAGRAAFAEPDAVDPTALPEASSPPSNLRAVLARREIFADAGVSPSGIGDRASAPRHAAGTLSRRTSQEACGEPSVDAAITPPPGVACREKCDARH